MLKVSYHTHKKIILSVQSGHLGLNTYYMKTSGFYNKPCSSRLTEQTEDNHQQQSKVAGW